MDTEVKEQLFNLTRRLELTKEGLMKAQINEKNKALVPRFETYLCSRGISEIRKIKYLADYKAVALIYDKPFEEYTADDCSEVMKRLKEATKPANDEKGNVIKDESGNPKLVKRYKDTSLNDYVSLLRILFKFLDGVKGKGQSHRTEHLQKIMLKDKLRKEDMVTEEEVNRIICSMPTLQYQTIFSLIFEGGARPEELRGALITDVTKIERGYKIMISGKTGMRPLFAITSAPLLTRWLNSHAFLQNKDDVANKNIPLFYGGYKTNGKPKFWQHQTWYSMFTRACKRVLGRSVPIYWLRHSRICNMVDKGIQTSRIKAVVGHSRGSTTLERCYLHMNDDTIEQTSCEAAGVEYSKEKKVKGTFTAKTCKNCGVAVAPHQLICEECGEKVDPTIKVINQEFNPASLPKDQLEKYLDFIEERLAQRRAEQNVNPVVK